MYVQNLWQGQKAVLTIVEFEFFDIFYSKFQLVSTFSIWSKFCVENWLFCCDLSCKWITCRSGCKRLWKSALHIYQHCNHELLVVAHIFPRELTTVCMFQSCLTYICDPSRHLSLTTNCGISYIWKSILSAQKWYLLIVNWMQQCNFVVKIDLNFYFLCFFFHTNGLIFWNAFTQQVPCFDVMVTYAVTRSFSKWDKVYTIKHLKFAGT